jgi:hypothetical protein
MPDRGPQVPQVSGYVNESGFLERTSRRAVQRAAFMPGLNAVN